MSESAAPEPGGAPGSGENIVVTVRRDKGTHGAVRRARNDG
jgi:hypothetical protein